MTRSLTLFSAVLVTSLALSMPQTALSHAGHGDEFQATGGINRVEVKTETDSLLGIRVVPIEAATGGAILIPVTAAVEDEGRQIVFVQYEGFYEPVEITTGASQGDLIEVTDGLSVGEQLVTAGGLSLYAESRKTKTAAATATDSPDGEISAAALTEAEHAQADAEGIPHSHGEGEEHHHEDELESGGLSKRVLAAIGGGVGLLAGAVFLAKGSGNRSETSN